MAWNNTKNHVKRQTPQLLPTGFHNAAVDERFSVQDSDTVCYYDYNQQQRGRSGGRNFSSSGSHVNSSTPPPPQQQQRTPPRPHSSSQNRQKGSGFQMVTVQAPGCPVQHFRICVGNDPDDMAAWIKERKRKFPRQKKLTDLLGAYGDSSDEDEPPTKHNDERKELQSNEKVAETGLPARSTKRTVETATSLPKKRRRLCRYFANGTCKNGDQCPFSHEPNHKPAVPSNRLMDKLLEQERKREAALTLQLLFVLHSEFNYFQDVDHANDNGSS